MSESRYPRESNLLGALALALSDRMRESTEAAAKHTAAAPAALVALHEFLGGRSVDDLRRAIGLTHSGAVRLVDRMVAQGYVERRPGADGRSVALQLTAGGHRAARRILAARAGALDDLLGQLSEADHRALTRITEKMLRAITLQRLAERRRNRPPIGGWMCRLCDFQACGRPQGACPAANAASE
jgi:MarR family transcriptional repressor of emrRAB